MNTEQETVRQEIKSLVELLPLLSTLERQIGENPTNFEYLSDIAFLCNKSLEVIDNVKKKVLEIQEKGARQACMLFAQTEIKNWKGDNCTVSPNASYYVKFPQSPREDGFETFVKGLPIEAIRPHYPTIEDQISECLKNGDQIPFGLEKEKILGVHFKLRVSSKKEL